MPRNKINANLRTATNFELLFLFHRLNLPRPQRYSAKRPFRRASSRVFLDKSRFDKIENRLLHLP